MAQVYTVTASTSVVLISSITAPNTIVLLSNVSYPGHLVGIRDTTGSNQIAQYPVIVSTISGITFYDGTSSLLLNQPNGYISLSSKDPSTWQVLNTYGFLTTLSNGFLQTLTAQSAYLTLMSSSKESVSSMVAGNVDVLSSIQILGATNIQGSITIGGSFDVFSSLQAFQSVFLSSSLLVGGNVRFPSSLSIKDTLQVGSHLSTLQSLTIQDELVIDTSLYVKGALLPPFVSVQTLQVDSLQTGGGLQVFGGISSINVSVQSNVVVLGSAVFQSTLQNQGLLSVYDNLTIDKAFQTQTLQVGQEAAIGSSVETQTLSASGGMSTLGSLSLAGRFTGSNGGLLEGQVQVLSTSVIQKLDVLGQATISSFAVYGTLRSEGDASSWANTFVVSSNLDVQGSLVLGKRFEGAGAYVSVQDGLSTLTNLAVFENLSVTGPFQVQLDSAIEGNVGQASTLVVSGNVSTTFLSAEGQVFVDGSLYVNQTASASTLAAPIGLRISTLTLSNALVIRSYGSIPEFDVNEYPDRMSAGPTSNMFSNDLFVDGILQNRSSVQQTYPNEFSKLWFANTLRTSTLSGLSNISTAVIGTTNFEYPLRELTGLVVVGSNSLGGSNISYAFSPSTLFSPAKGNFLFRGNKVKYGNNMWVAVGQGLTSNESIQYSADGYNWFNTTTGGFPQGGYGIAYGGGTWIATGSVGSPMATNESIQYSGNGITWTNAGGQVFPKAGNGGRAAAYNGSNLWVAVGQDTANGGIKRSGNGITWSNVTMIPPNNSLTFVAVGFGNGLWLASDGANATYSSSNGTQWFILPSATPRLAYNFISIDSSNGAWFAGGSNLGGDPRTTIQISFNGSNFFPIQSGGFQTACYDIVANLAISSFVAVGANAVPTDTILQYSSNAQNWVNNSVFFGQGFGLGIGQIIAPNEKPLFNVNLTSIFHSNVSVATLYASTINASSVFGTYNADGRNLGRVGSYTSSIRVSSLSNTTINTFQVSTNRFFANIGSFFPLPQAPVRVSDSINVPRTTFFSTGNLFLAAGDDFLASGNIQTSVNGPQWTRGLNNTFQFYGNDVAGNSNENNPLFVAVGADTRTAYTIQYSQNGRVWFPANTGGFSYATSVGKKEGLSVAYSQTLNRWVAVGRSVGSTNTILYSSDGSNWSEANGGFQDYGTKVKVQTNWFVAIGNGVRWSSDGINWFPSGAQPALTAIGYGRITSGPTTTDAWLGVANTTIWTSVNNGISWSQTASNTFAPVSDLLFRTIGSPTPSNLWVAVGSNVIQNSVTGFAWNAVTTSFSNSVSFNSITYNPNLNLMIAGARSAENLQTLWQSVSPQTWNPITSGGFSTSVEDYGIGYGVFSLAMSTIAVGKAALDVNLNVLPSILILSTNAGVAGSTITTLSLTASNASNVFSTSVRGIWGTTNEFYKFVAVGDGINPSKTIGRSIDATPGSWLPAITGGFSTTGYGVTYYKDRWFAVGDAQTSTNTIQFSPDGGNWFGANTARGIRQGGRGIAVGIGALGNTLVAVGKDNTTSTIVYSGNGSNWSNATGSNFNGIGNGVAAGSNGSAPIFIAVGQDTRGTTNTILRSADGITWNTIATGGFSIAGYGAAWNKDTGTWVAVGEDSDTTKTIQYSLDGGGTFLPTINAFTSAGYGVNYNSSIGIFFAVGKDTAGDAPNTIKYSDDGVTWNNFSTGTGFISQKSIGSANGLFSQPILTRETTPYMEFSNLVVYERTEPFLYFKPTIRLQSTFVSFNESLFVNISSQVIINSNVPIGIADFSVHGTTYASSFLYTGSIPFPSTLFVSSMIVSTLSSIGTIDVRNLTTPAFGVNSRESRPNFISTTENATTSLVNINNALFISPTDAIVDAETGNATYPSGFQYTSQGIRNLNPQYPLHIAGTFGASTLSTTFLYAPNNIYISASRTYLQDDYFRIFEGTNPSLVLEENRIQTNPSSLTINSILTLQVSTQRVGMFTTNPQYDLDVQRLAFLSNLNTNTINTSLLFLTLQSI